MTRKIWEIDTLKKLVTALVLLLTAGAMLGACGGGGRTGPMDAGQLAIAADRVCSENNVLFDDLGTRGFTNPEIADEFRGTAAVRRQFVKKFQELEFDPTVSVDWLGYINATYDLAISDEEIAQAAADDDNKALDEAFAAQDAIFGRRDRLGRKLGLMVCGRTAAIHVTKTGTGPPPDVVYSKPKNTIQSAAETFVGVLLKNDCARVNTLIHSDASGFDGSECQLLVDNLKGGKVAGTEQYGPVGMAEAVGAKKIHYAMYFVNDRDGKLKYADDAIHDSGGLRPAPADNDADETAAALVTAVREGDAEAFNEVTVDSKEARFMVNEEGFKSVGIDEAGVQFVKDVRKSGAVAQPLGINAAWAFYMVPGSKHDWAIALIHVPGNKHQYRFSGLYPMPKPK